MTSPAWEVVLFTVVMALAATVVMVPPAVALGWMLARGRVPFKSAIETLVTLPLVIPPVATGFLLLRLFGHRSPLGRFFDAVGAEIVFTWRAVLAAMVVMGLPLVIRTVRAGFEQRTRRYEQIAETLGASPWRVFATISLPLARRTVVAGALLGFARAIGEFGATIVIAGNIPGRTTTIAVATFTALESGRDTDAAGFVAASIVIAFAAVWLSNRIGEGGVIESRPGAGR